jgi:hypothetical protein
MNLFPSLFHHSGGAIYHWRALKNVRKLWSPHREQTRAFLDEWNPKSESITLIGPSGGYSLPKAWLKKFKSITAFEPDPIARKIFEWRTGTKPHWIKTPFRFEDLRNGSLTLSPKSAVLFCNLLGQLDFDEEAGLLAQEELCKLTESHELASYHDVLSGNDFRFEWTSPMDGDEPIRVKYEMEALDGYFNANEGITELDLHVHPAAFLFQDQDLFRYQYWEWQITKKQTQVIEGAYALKPKD